jgi:3-oxoacyl-[acyl-carrier protein] reductase
MAMYGASKAAVLSLTKSMALEFAADGVRVNAISPARLPPAISQGLFDALKAKGEYEAVVKEHPLGRLGDPDDVAKAALHLASDEAKWVTGVCLGVGGGMSATW